jgi:nucleoside 2-deoxyribosyltransferase
MNQLREQGHTITFDWTKQVEQVGPSHQNELAKDKTFLRECAKSDINGVRECDWFVAIGHPEACGTLIEMGVAIAEKKPIYVLDLDEFRYSIFFELDQISRVHSEAILLQAFSPDNNVARAVDFV